MKELPKTLKDSIDQAELTQNCTEEAGFEIAENQKSAEEQHQRDLSLAFVDIWEKVLTCYKDDEEKMIKAAELMNKDYLNEAVKLEGKVMAAEFPLITGLLCTIFENQGEKHLPSTLDIN